MFDKNVIVDLSRVGSSETKSLIMGLLVMKLQEHRIAACTEMNAKLNHVTVLEEAHNLLKRTSTGQSSEGANLLGKSVEMLTNAIAEMRTYGEGFIIELKNGEENDVKLLLSYNERDPENIYKVIEYFVKTYNGTLIPFAVDSAGNYYCEQGKRIVLWTQNKEILPICNSFSQFLEALYELE